MKIRKLVPWFLLASAPVFAQTSSTGPTHTVIGGTEVKKNAAEQLAYGRQLINMIPTASGDEQRRMELAWNAITALRVIPDRWPHEKPLVTEALLAQEDVLLNQNFLSLALDVLHAAEQSAVGTDSIARIYAEEGFVNRRLNRLDEADAAFDRAEHHAAFHTLPVVKRAAALSEYADVEAKLGRAQQAALHFRAAADLPNVPTLLRLRMTLASFEQDDRLTDKAEAKKDLARLDDLLLEARKTTSAAPDIAQLDEFEREIRRHHARLGV